MSWIGRKIYEYLKECEEFKKDMCEGYQPNDRLDTSNPPISDAFVKRKSSTDIVEEYLTGSSRDKVLEDWDANRLHNFFSGKSFAGLDKRKVGEEMSNAKGCVPKTDNIPPAPKRNAVEFSNDPAKFVWLDEKGIKHNVDLNKQLVDFGITHQLEPERVPFENFKNNRKKMNKEVKNVKDDERCIISSVNKEGIVTITIEPKKGIAISGFNLDVKTGDLQKEPVLSKELLSPKPELQAQYDTLAKLITTMDYYNGQKTFMGCDIVTTINENGKLETERYGVTSRKLYFRNNLIAGKFLENFRTEIEQVNHLI